MREPTNGRQAGRKTVREPGARKAWATAAPGHTSVIGGDGPAGQTSQHPRGVRWL